MVEENYPSKPFYRVETELLHIACGIVDYHGVRRTANFVLLPHFPDG
jgi:hypothetical protein